MNNFSKSPISSILGVLLIIFAAVLLFVETKYELPLLALGVVALVGVLLLFAKDELIDILTLGLKSLFERKLKK